MLNQLVLVGRVAKLPSISKDFNVEELRELHVEVDRAYRNENGEIGTDILPVVLSKSMLDAMQEPLRIGALMGIKGRLESKTSFCSDGQTLITLRIRAEKVSFLSPENQ